MATVLPRPLRGLGAGRLRELVAVLDAGAGAGGISAEADCDVDPLWCDPWLPPGRLPVARLAVEPLAVEPLTVEPLAVEPLPVARLAVEPLAAEPLTVERFRTGSAAATPAPAGRFADLSAAACAGTPPTVGSAMVLALVRVPVRVRRCGFLRVRRFGNDHGGRHQAVHGAGDRSWDLASHAASSASATNGWVHDH